MFDIAPSEFLLIALVAIVVIGPKDLPLALRTAGRWVAKMRRMSAHFRSGVEAMIREAELEEMEKKWREQNAAIMAQHPPGEAYIVPAIAPPAGEASTAEATAEHTPDADEWSAQWAAHTPAADPAPASAEAAVKTDAPDTAPRP